MVLDCGQMENPQLLSPLNLAFVGDGVYELMVRRTLAAQGSMPMGRLHRMTVALVCAEAQAKAVQALLPVLSEEELTYFKRGRNASSAGVPRHADPAQYRYATGLETLFGWLYLSGRQERLEALFQEAMRGLGQNG